LRAAISGAAGILLGAPAFAASSLRRGKPDVGSPLGLGKLQQTASGRGDTQPLADDLFLLQIPGEANVVAHTSGGGVLLVDGGSANAADALTKLVAGLPGGGPIHTMFNTHWHPEQVGLNEQLGKAGKTIIAHENTRLWLTTDVTWSWNGQQFKRLPKIAQPNKTFYKTGKLELSKEERREGVPVDSIQYGYIPDAAHTDGDMYVYFPRQNVLAVGDAISGQGWPVVDWATGGWIGGIVGAFQRIQVLANDQTRIVPGRGPVLTLAEVKTHYQMYSTIYDRLTTLLNKGRGPSEAVEARPTKEFDAQMGNGDEFVRRAFESLWAYLSPDA
jgi:glyoxylase-like metal-dependent hydrolase (beta-lactamase superfamily II)